MRMLSTKTIFVVILVGLVIVIFCEFVVYIHVTKIYKTTKTKDKNSNNILDVTKAWPKGVFYKGRIKHVRPDDTSKPIDKNEDKISLDIISDLDSKELMTFNFLKSSVRVITSDGTNATLNNLIPGLIIELSNNNKTITIRILD